MSAAIEAALRDAVGAQHVSSGTRALQPYGGGADESRGAEPTWVVVPGSAAEVADVVRLATREKLVVVPWGTGSSRSSVIATQGRPRIVLDMKRMSNVLHLDEVSLVVHAQAGLTARTLEELLIPRGLTLGDFPPSALPSSLGGLMAARAPGRMTPRHGFLEDACLGLSAVLADGRTIHTRIAPRRATGPDLSRVLMGSEGTLAVITGVVLRIDRRPEVRLFEAHAFAGDDGVDRAMAVVEAAMRADARPTAMGVFDGAAVTAHYGASAVPPGLGQGGVLVAAAGGLRDLANVDLAIIAEAAVARGGRSLGGALAETWWTRRAMAYGLAYAAAAPLLPGQDARNSALEAARHGGPHASGKLPPVDLELYATLAALPAIYHAALEHVRGLGCAPRAHLGRFDERGGMAFVAADPPLSPAERAAADAAVASLGAHKARASWGGPGLVRTYHALKRELDPHGILNPDRVPPEPA